MPRSLARSELIRITSYNVCYTKLLRKPVDIDVLSETLKAANEKIHKAK